MKFYGLHQWLSGKESACSAVDTGDVGSVPGQEDPLGEGMATHYSILTWRITWDSRAWQAAIHGVIKNQTQLKQLSIYAHM